MKLPKVMARFAAVTAALVGLIVLLLLAVAARLVWQLHFWIPEGHAFSLGQWRFEDYEFQVWQRKTQYAFEPFADGLFVRHGTNEWQVFCFDIQDNYSPNVQLRKVGNTVKVIRNGKNCGIFDMTSATFQSATDRAVVTPGGLGNANEPPGQWWLR